MDEILGQVLRNAVWERLDMLTEVAENTEDRKLVTVARSELPKLTEGWRGLLAAHEPDAKGNCPECSSRWRQQQSPCPIWRAAYEHLVGGALAARPTELIPGRRTDVGTQTTAGVAY